MRFKNKVVLATGVATGLGSVAARLFAAEGASLLLVDFNAEELVRLVAELRSSGSAVDYVVGDVSKAVVASEAVDKAEQVFGRLDILLNNAGINPVGNIVDTSEEVWDRTMGVNLKSAYLFTARAIPLMEKTGGGVIVNTASIASFKASTAEAAYSVSKAGLLQLTRVTSKDFAARGIRANALCPGFLPRFMADRNVSATEEQQRARSQRAADLVPLGREGSYEEMAEVMAFLASDQSSYITGIGLTADGGQTV
jgi:NAD(P)-dependent dehydrogenase (short-subunit alcohol dehydrogenase family)